MAELSMQMAQLVDPDLQAGTDSIIIIPHRKHIKI